MAWLVAGLLWLAAPLLAAAPPSVDPECAEVETLFQRNAAAELGGLTPGTLRGVAHQQFRLASVYIQEDDLRAARRAVRLGLRAVRSGLAAQPDDVELLLLGAMLDGEQVLVRRWSFLTSGLRGMRRLTRAERLDPGNPRAALVRGTAKVVLPGIIGGDVREAIEILRSALHERALCEQGEWGQADLLMWLGRAHAKLDAPEQAQVYYQQALARQPDSHWVRKAMAGHGYEWTEPP